MFTMDLYARIRRALRVDGPSRRVAEICKDTPTYLEFALSVYTKERVNLNSIDSNYCSPYTSSHSPGESRQGAERSLSATVLA